MTPSQADAREGGVDAAANKDVVRRVVDEVFFFEFEDGRISRVWGLEDTWERLRQLGVVGG